MRAVIQRVLKASVEVDGSVVGSIGPGLCVLVAIRNTDTIEDAEYLVKKILSIRLFSDENEKPWSKSVKEKAYSILSVSQFTLHAITSKGSKPDFHLAMRSDTSKEFYDKFLKMLRDSYEADKIEDGEFGAMMNVNIVNDGPVTIIIDSQNKGM